MRKICFRILIAIVVIIVSVNIVAWNLYPTEQWNFNYGHSYDVYVKEIILKSSNDSEIRKLCQQDLDCKLMLDQYSFNGTISSKPAGF